MKILHKVTELGYLICFSVGDLPEPLSKLSHR